MKMRAFRRSLKTLGAVLLTAGTLTALKPAVSFAAYSYPSAAKYTAGDAATLSASTLTLPLSTTLIFTRYFI